MIPKITVNLPSNFHSADLDFLAEIVKEKQSAAESTGSIPVAEAGKIYRLADLVGQLKSSLVKAERKEAKLKTAEPATV